MGLQNAFENEMAIDTFSELKKFNVSFVVLEETLDEIIRSIQYYLKQSEPYTSSQSQLFHGYVYQTSGIDSAVQNGVSRSRLLHYTYRENLKKSLKEHYNIQVVSHSADIPDSDIVSLIRYKNRNSFEEQAALHDLKIIDYCRTLRVQDNCMNSSVANTKHWVLTCDSKLAKWHSIKNGQSTVLCITETQLSNLLWICGDKFDNNGLLNSMIAFAQNSMLNTDDLLNFYKNTIESCTLEYEIIDSIALVFANDTLSVKDIKDAAHASQEDFIEIINSKTQVISGQKNENEKEIQDLKDAIAELKDILAKKNKQGDAEKNLSEYKLLKDHRTYLEDCILKIKKREKNWGVFFGILIGLLLPGTFLVIYGKYNFVFFNIMNSFGVSENIHNVIGSGIVILISETPLYIFAIIGAGRFLSPFQLHDYLTNRFALKPICNEIEKYGWIKELFVIEKSDALSTFESAKDVIRILSTEKNAIELKLDGLQIPGTKNTESTDMVSLS